MTTSVADNKLTRGINNPLLFASRSRTAEALVTLPVVLIATLWALNKPHTFPEGKRLKEIKRMGNIIRMVLPRALELIGQLIIIGEEMRVSFFICAVSFFAHLYSTR